MTKQSRKQYKASRPLATIISKLYELRNDCLQHTYLQDKANEWQVILGIAFDIQKGRPTNENIKSLSNLLLKAEGGTYLLEMLKEDCIKSFPNDVERINLLLTFS